MKSKPYKLMTAFSSIFINCNSHGEQTWFSATDHHWSLEMRYWSSTIHWQLKTFLLTENNCFIFTFKERKATFLANTNYRSQWHHAEEMHFPSDRREHGQLEILAKNPKKNPSCFQTSGVFKGHFRFPTGFGWKCVDVVGDRLPALLPNSPTCRSL